MILRFLVLEQNIFCCYDFLPAHGLLSMQTSRERNCEVRRGDIVSDSGGLINLLGTCLLLLYESDIPQYN